jgi:hypothetical protein
MLPNKGVLDIAIWPVEWVKAVCVGVKCGGIRSAYKNSSIIQGLLGSFSRSAAWAAESAHVNQFVMMVRGLWFLRGRARGCQQQAGQRDRDSPPDQSVTHVALLWASPEVTANSCFLNVHP